MEILVNRVYEKRATEKSAWSGRVGAVSLVGAVDSIKIDGKELTKVSVEYLVNFGLQCLQDAYAGADSLVDAQAAFGKKYDALLAGTIGVRAAGIGDEERWMARFAAAALSKKYGDAFDKASDDEKTTRVASAIAKNEAHFRTAAQKKIAQIEADRKAKAELQSEIDI